MIGKFVNRSNNDETTKDGFETAKELVNELVNEAVDTTTG